MITQRVIVYGSKDGGKYVTAMKLMADNPFFSEPFIISDMKRMKEFLTGQHSLGIINAPTVDHILKRCQGSYLGSVLFIADPTATEQAGEDLISDVIWSGSSAAETLDRLHSA